MAIVNLVDYDQSVTLELKDPRTDTPIGVRFEVRSIENDDAQNILRKRRGKAISKMVMSGKAKPSEDDAAPILMDMVEPDGEVLATCVVGWNWGGQEFEDGGGVLEFTPENARYVLTHPKMRWMRSQVLAAAQSVDVFLKA